VLEPIPGSPRAPACTPNHPHSPPSPPCPHPPSPTSPLTHAPPPSPGLTNENIVTVFVEVNGDSLPGGRPGAQALEEDETIEVELLPLGPDLAERLGAYEDAGFGVWVGLHAVAQGMRLGTLYGMPSLAGGAGAPGPGGGPSGALASPVK
jgi:hypothetical protein